MLFSPVFACTEPRLPVPILSGSVHSGLRSATRRPRLLFARPTALAVCPAPSQHFRFSPFHFLVLTNSFRINTCGLACKCGKQRTYREPKSFRCNTYKKHMGEGWLLLARPSTKVVCSESATAEERGICHAARWESLPWAGAASRRTSSTSHQSLVTSHLSCATLER
jgi:hypothetical protein